MVAGEFARERFEAVCGWKSELKVADFGWRDPACAVFEKVSRLQFVDAESAGFVVLQKIRFTQTAYRKRYRALRKPQFALKPPNRCIAINSEL